MPIRVDTLDLKPLRNDGLCAQCGINKRTEHHGWCLDCRRADRYEKQFGITFEQYNEMLERQDNVCAICKKLETATNRGTVKSLAVDHCHESGQVRGLLCMSCNMLVGRLEKELEVSKMAFDYIENVGPS